MVDSLILVVNAGSATLKCALYGYHVHHATVLEKLVSFNFDRVLKTLVVTYAREKNNPDTIEEFAPTTEGSFLKEALAFVTTHITKNYKNATLLAVGHRVVHGGSLYKKPVKITNETFQHLKSFESLAILHQPYNLEGAIYCAAQFENVPQIACFDTAFHQTHSKVARLYGLPYHYYEQGVRRFGFHGLSYEFIRDYMESHHESLALGRLLVAHLGSGASLCALQDGKSVDSTLGFTALDGLPMGTRPGQLDPGVLLFLMRQGLDEATLTHLLYKQSGLLGISGLSGDMRHLESSPDPRAQLAIDYFVYRLVREIGGLIALLGGVDALIFTAGIGENSALIRELTVQKLAHYGFFLDQKHNRENREIISAKHSEHPVLVIKTDEQLQIAKQCVQMLQQP